jgi:hypothetical protein
MAVVSSTPVCFGNQIGRFPREQKKIKNLGIFLPVRQPPLSLGDIILKEVFLIFVVKNIGTFVVNSVAVRNDLGD